LYNDPWNRLLSSNYPAGLAVIADKSPLYDTDNFLRITTSTDDDDWVTVNQAFPEVLNYSLIGTSSENSDWTKNNSNNHKHTLQNVGYLGGHVRRETKPTVGVSNDNIYTYNDIARPAPREWMLGTWPNASAYGWQPVGALMDARLLPQAKSDSVLGN